MSSTAATTDSSLTSTTSSSPGVEEREERNDTYFLRSSRLGFRCWREEDFEMAMGLWGDPEVTQLIGGPFSVDQVRARLTKEIATLRDHEVQYYACFLLSSGEHVGCCGFKPYYLKSEDGRVTTTTALTTTFEFGFQLRKAFWRQGLGEEAAKAVIHHAFETRPKLQTLFAGHHPSNEPSRRLLLKLGFRYSHDEFYPPTGLMHPGYVFERPTSN